MPSGSLTPYFSILASERFPSKFKSKEFVRSKPRQRKVTQQVETEVPTTPLTTDLVGRLQTALKTANTTAEEAILEGVQERVAKRISRCGLCSRREAERWIEAGRVKIDGEIVSDVGALVTPKNVLAVDNIPIRAEPPKLFMFNKVRNMLVTRYADEKGRDTLGELLEEMGQPALLPVGRLDFTSEGLLLLTNDGELKQYLEKPDSELIRVYRVRIYGRVRQDRFTGLENGITIDGFRYKGLKITVESANERKGPRPEPQWRLKLPGANVPSPDSRANTWLKVELHEGKNREIRRVLEHLGLEVSRLIRIQYGPYLLTPDVESGIVKQVPVVEELKPHCGQTWNWHPQTKSKKSSIAPSLAALDGAPEEDGFQTEATERRMSMPKSNPPPNRRPKKSESSNRREML